MGDISEMRAIVVICAFVIFTIVMVGLMFAESPAVFSDATQGSANLPTESKSPSELLAWNETYILNITGTFEYTFPIGGGNVRVQKWDNHVPSDGIFMETYDYWWIFQWNRDNFKWFKDGVDVSIWADIPPAPGQWRIPISRLDEDFASGKGINYVAINSKTQFDVAFSFNTSTFSKPSDAFYGNDIHMIFNVDFENRQTSINALSFISSLFTFSLPGIPFIVNLMIWISIFPALAYLIFIIILRTIGAIFGGGA